VYTQLFSLSKLCKILRNFLQWSLIPPTPSGASQPFSLSVFTQRSLREQHQHKLVLVSQAKADVKHLDAEYHLLLDSLRQVSQPVSPYLLASLLQCTFVCPSVQPLKLLNALNLQTSFWYTGTSSEFLGL